MKPLLSALGFVAAGSLMFLVKSYISDNETILQKQVLKQILITLRKRVFSTLRQIAFVVNNIRANESDFEPKKISDIIMKDGGSGDAKLNLIEQMTLKSYEVTRSSFEASCNFYKGQDYEIRLLLKNLSMDIEMALTGTIENYNGPTIFLSPERVIHIYRQILKSSDFFMKIGRMQNIKEKLINQSSTEDCIKREFMIEEYLEMQGVKSDKEPNEKVFISILERHYREDADFRIQFENLEVEMHEFMEEIEKEHNQNRIKKIEKQNMPVPDVKEFE